MLLEQSGSNRCRDNVYERIARGQTVLVLFQKLGHHFARRLLAHRDRKAAALSKDVQNTSSRTRIQVTLRIGTRFALTAGRLFGRFNHSSPGRYPRTLGCDRRATTSLRLIEIFCASESCGPKVSSARILKNSSMSPSKGVCWEPTCPQPTYGLWPPYREIG